MRSTKRITSGWGGRQYSWLLFAADETMKVLLLLAVPLQAKSQNCGGDKQ
jgi:hypothetical protein